MKVAIYARYSSDQQRDASIADQLRICRARAEKEGWQVVEEYTDHAISGASLWTISGSTICVIPSHRTRCSLGRT